MRPRSMYVPIFLLFLFLQLIWAVKRFPVLCNNYWYWYHQWTRPEPEPIWMSVNNLAATRASAGIRTGARKWQISVKVHYQRHLLQNESATCAIIKSAKQRGQYRLDRKPLQRTMFLGMRSYIGSWKLCVWDTVKILVKCLKTLCLWHRVRHFS